MHQKLRDHYDLAIKEFTSGEYYELLKEAKDIYFGLTGKAEEEHEDYESRMNIFNDWYLLEHISKDGDYPPIEKYLSSNDIEPDIKKAFLSFEHSLFEYNGQNRKKEIVLKDHLNSEKRILSKDHLAIPFVKGDLFIGRILTFKEDSYLMIGLSVLPREAKKIIIKEAKDISSLKISNPDIKTQFLLATKSFKSKFRHYAHVDIEKIFDYSGPEDK